MSRNRLCLARNSKR